MFGQRNFCNSFNIFKRPEGSHDPPLRPSCAWVDLPETNATEKSVSVVAKLYALRQLVELLRASAANNDVIGNK